MFDEDQFWAQLDDWVLLTIAIERSDEPDEPWEEFLEAIGDIDDSD